MQQESPFKGTSHTSTVKRFYKLHIPFPDVIRKGNLPRNEFVQCADRKDDVRKRTVSSLRCSSASTLAQIKAVLLSA